MQTESFTLGFPNVNRILNYLHHNSEHSVNLLAPRSFLFFLMCWVFSVLCFSTLNTSDMLPIASFFVAAFIIIAMFFSLMQLHCSLRSFLTDGSLCFCSGFIAHRLVQTKIFLIHEAKFREGISRYGLYFLHLS